MRDANEIAVRPRDRTDRTQAPAGLGVCGLVDRTDRTAVTFKMQVKSKSGRGVNPTVTRLRCANFTWETRRRKRVRVPRRAADSLSSETSRVRRHMCLSLLLSDGYLCDSVVIFQPPSRAENEELTKDAQKRLEEARREAAKQK